MVDLRFWLIVFVLILGPSATPANAGLLDFLFGYKDYDDCIKGEMKSADSNNKPLIRAIVGDCRRQFPITQSNQERGKIIWKRLPVRDLRCKRRSDNPSICLVYATIENPFDMAVTQIRLDSSLAGADCTTADVEGSIYPMLFILPQDEVYDQPLARIRDGGKSPCFWVYGRFRE
jgi:hypothetical protein